MNDNKMREAELRLAEDIKVVESLKQLQNFKSFQQFQDSFVRPNIRRLYREIENSAKNSNVEAYYAKFYAAQGEIKILERLDDLEDLIEHYDSEIKGLKQLFKDAKT